MDFYQNSPLTTETKPTAIKSIGILVVVIVILIIIAIALVLYKGNFTPANPESNVLTEEQRANMIRALEEEEILPLTDEQRANMIKALEAE